MIRSLKHGSLFDEDGDIDGSEKPCEIYMSNLIFAEYCSVAGQAPALWTPYIIRRAPLWGPQVRTSFEPMRCQARVFRRCVSHIYTPSSLWNMRTLAL